MAFIEQRTPYRHTKPLRCLMQWAIYKLMLGGITYHGAKMQLVCVIFPLTFQTQFSVYV